MATDSTLPKIIAPGARVEVRGEEWLVKNVRKLKDGYSYKVVGLTELVRGQHAIFLTTLDEIIEIRPEDTIFVNDESERFKKSRLYLEALLRRTTPSDNKLYIGEKGAFNEANYQLKPAHLALSNLRSRILIADAVGLGKTIEIGILLSELIKRGRGERILVVTMKSMLGQFQQEMWSRFTIPLVRLDSVGIQKVRSKIPSNKNPFNYYNKVIISVDTLKNDSQYRTFLEQCHWDAIVIDECHNVANANTQRNRLANLLASTCDSLILTSATPHNGKPESFAQLINMLEPTAVANEQEYTHEEISNLFTRRFKKDVEYEVGNHFRDRELILNEIDISVKEEEILSYIQTLKFNILDGKKNSKINNVMEIKGAKDTLFKNTLLKAFLSSPYACLSTVEKRISKIEQRFEKDGFKTTLLEEDYLKLIKLQQMLKNLGIEDFKKYSKFVEILKDIKWNGNKKSPRIVLFSERKDTINFLADQLKEMFSIDDSVIQVFHAGLSDIEQQRIVEDFGKENASVRILLATDVASEGVNLHYYSNHLIHFDIPWSLISIEQRNGRIDRYGQEKTPYIYYLVAKSDQEDIDADLRIIQKLIAKEQEAHKNLGDVGTIMGLFDPEKEAEAIEEALVNNNIDDLFNSDVGSFLDNILSIAEAAELESYPKGKMSSIMSDFEFTKEALEIVTEDSDKAKETIEFLETEEAIRWFVPDDIKQTVLYNLPKEAFKSKNEFYLTTNRDSVQESIKLARKTQKEWPLKQLLWEQHPLFNYLIDRVLIAFDKNEAPIITLTQLNENEIVYLIQGTLFNKRAQQVISQWFGVKVNVISNEIGIMNFSEFNEKLMLENGFINSGQLSINKSTLEEYKLTAIKMVKDKLNGLREVRKNNLAQTMVEDQRKLENWKKSKLVQIKNEISQKELNNTLNKAIKAKLESKEKEVLRIYSQRRDWIRESMATDANPYLKIAAVFVRK